MAAKSDVFLTLHEQGVLNATFIERGKGSVAPVRVIVYSAFEVNRATEISAKLSKSLTSGTNLMSVVQLLKRVSLGATSA